MEAAFSILFLKKNHKSLSQDNRRRSRAAALGTVTCPCLTPGLPCKGRGRTEDEKEQMLLPTDTVANGVESRKLRAADSISQTTSLEALLWPPPFGVHFSVAKGWFGECLSLATARLAKLRLPRPASAAPRHR